MLQKRKNKVPPSHPLFSNPDGRARIPIPTKPFTMFIVADFTSVLSDSSKQSEGGRRMVYRKRGIDGGCDGDTKRRYVGIMLIKASRVCLLRVLNVWNLLSSYWKWSCLTHSGQGSPEKGCLSSLLFDFYRKITRLFFGSRIIEETSSSARRERQDK